MTLKSAVVCVSYLYYTLPSYGKSGVWNQKVVHDLTTEFFFAYPSN